MYSPLYLRDFVNQGLKDLKFPDQPSSLYKAIKYVLELEAKRVRPILFLLSYQIFNSNLEKVLSPSLGIEIFHNFTLLHDDIMDKAVIRRGSPTVHKKFGDNVAILAGDTMLVKSYELISDIENKNIKEVISIFNNIATRICEGQQFDIDFESKLNVSISNYLKMIEYKTSILLSGALKIGAILGGANKNQANNLYNFGRGIGTAFQLQDDLLDLYSDSTSFGKSVGRDVVNNKKTYLYLKAVELSNKKQKKELEKYFMLSDINENEKIEKVKHIFDQLEISYHTQELIETYYNKSIKYLDEIGMSETKTLFDFIQNLLKRKN